MKTNPAQEAFQAGCVLVKQNPVLGPLWERTTIHFDDSYPCAREDCQPEDSEMLPEYNPAAQDSMIYDIVYALRYLRNFNTFTEAEARAILPLYKYISCIEYRQIEAFRKYQWDERKLSLLFDGMEQELAREVNPFYEAMMDGISVRNLQ